MLTQETMLPQFTPPGPYASIGDLESAAGVTDRAAFWDKFKAIEPPAASLDAGVAELRRMITERLAQVPPIWMVCGSNRARNALLAITGPQQGYNLAFTGHDIQHRGIYPVPAHQIDRVLAIKGVRRLAAARIPHLKRYWSG